MLLPGLRLAARLPGCRASQAREAVEIHTHTERGARNTRGSSTAMRARRGREVSPCRGLGRGGSSSPHSFSPHRPTPLSGPAHSHGQYVVGEVVGRVGEAAVAAQGGPTDNKPRRGASRTPPSSSNGDSPSACHPLPGARRPAPGPADCACDQPVPSVWPCSAPCDTAQGMGAGCTPGAGADTPPPTSTELAGRLRTRLLAGGCALARLAPALPRDSSEAGAHPPSPSRPLALSAASFPACAEHLFNLKVGHHNQDC